MNITNYITTYIFQLFRGWHKGTFTESKEWKEIVVSQ